jgi:hypothetical protein
LKIITFAPMNMGFPKASFQNSNDCQLIQDHTD